MGVFYNLLDSSDTPTEPIAPLPGPVAPAAEQIAALQQALAAAQAALQAQQAYCAALVEALPDSVLLTTAEGQALAAN